jgi:hypothetical protein
MRFVSVTAGLPLLYHSNYEMSVWNISVLERYNVYSSSRDSVYLMTVSELAVCYTDVACDGSVIVNAGKDVEV